MDKTDCMWWIGFDSAEGRLLAGGSEETPDALRRFGYVPPKTTVTIVNRPQIQHFRGWRLCVHQPSASDFLIHSFVVGTKATTAAHGPIPADAFATQIGKMVEVEEMFKRDGYFAVKIDKTGAELMGNDWNLPVVFAGVDMAITVENISYRPSRFVAGMLGFGPPHGF